MLPMTAHQACISPHTPDPPYSQCNAAALIGEGSGLALQRASATIQTDRSRPPAA